MGADPYPILLVGKTRGLVDEGLVPGTPGFERRFPGTLRNYSRYGSRWYLDGSSAGGLRYGTTLSTGASPSNLDSH